MSGLIFPDDGKLEVKEMSFCHAASSFASFSGRVHTYSALSDDGKLEVEHGSLSFQRIGI